MLKKIILVLIFNSLCAIHVFAQLRTFDDIFPDVGQKIRVSALGGGYGYVSFTWKSGGFDLLIGSSKTSGIAAIVSDTVLERKPGFIIESISVISGENVKADLLDVYNALGNIRGLKGRLYNSYTRNQAVPLFEDATRIKSEKQTTEIPDPAPAKSVPENEIMYIKLKDVNFGNSYYKGEMTLIQNGLCYSMTNFKSLTYFLFPVIKEGKFIAKLYFEPISEGILIYSIAGADISDFVASKIDMDSAIAKRLAVITSWAADGISGTK
jgi:hypothetical protein